MIVLSRENNFDLLRLFASFQVVLFHCKERYNLSLDDLEWLRNFKGVPIFFTISGFLISYSCIRNKRNIKQYFANRILRLYPALYVVVFLSLISAFCTNDITVEQLLSKETLRWLVHVCTIDQECWTPLFSSFGIGCYNGSLWTIPVEVTFYIIIPLIVLFSTKYAKYVLMGIVGGGILYNHYYFSYTVVPMLYHFALGALALMYWDKIKIFLENKFIFWGSLYLLATFILKTQASMHIQSFEHLIMNIALDIMVLSAAFSYKSASKILKGNDISYGVYLFHGLIINILLEVCKTINHEIIFYTFAISIICGYISWNIIEKNALSLKNKIFVNEHDFKEGNS